MVNCVYYVKNEYFLHWCLHQDIRHHKLIKVLMLTSAVACKNIDWNHRKWHLECYNFSKTPFYTNVLLIFQHFLDSNLELDLRLQSALFTYDWIWNHYRLKLAFSGFINVLVNHILWLGRMSKSLLHWVQLFLQISASGSDDVVIVVLRMWLGGRVFVNSIVMQPDTQFMFTLSI